MKKALLNKKFLLFALGTFLVSLFFVVPHFAGAQTSIITDAAVGIFVGAFKVFAYIFNTVLGFLFMLAGGLVNIAMSLNAQILDKTNTLVTIGWTITRDVANLGFVLIMIVMAVATIVRYEKYSVQKLLPLLIGAAILVNFSLTIAGVFISFSDTISNAFSTRLIAGGATSRNFTDAIAGAFNPQRLLIKDTGNPSPPDPASQGNFLSDISAAALISISGLVFNVVFLAIAVLSMAALALMLLYRYIYLSILLILSPLAWMFWVFPDLEYLYKDWWKNFIKWCFFLPAVTFFLYLAVETAFQLKDSPIFINATGFTGALTSIMAQGAQMIVLAGLLLGGLIVAQKLGIEGASGAMKLATKAKDGALGAIGNYGKNRATSIGRRVLTSGVNEKGETRLERFGAKFGKIPLFGAMATGISGISSRAKAKSNKDLEDVQKKFENRTGDDAVNVLNRQVTGGGMMPDTELAAWGIKAAKEGKWEDIKNNNTKNRIVDAIKRTDSKDKILGFIPHLADKFVDPTKKTKEQAIQEAMSKYVTDASKLSPDILKEVALYLRPNQVNQVGNQGTDAQKDGAKDALEVEINRIRSTLPGIVKGNLETLVDFRNEHDKAVKEIDDAKAKGEDKATISSLQNKRDKIKSDAITFRDNLRTINKGADNALKVLDGMAQSLPWQDHFTREERVSAPF